MTTQLTTIHSAPAPAPAAEAAVEAVPTEVAQEAAPGAAPVVDENLTVAPEEKKPPEVDPDLEIAKRFDLIAQREARVRRHEAELKSKTSSLDAELKKAAELRAELEAALEDPVSYYQKKGKDPVEVVKRFAKPMTEEEKRLARLEEAEQKREEQRKKDEETAKQRQHRETVENAQRAFVRGTIPDEYPYLTTIYKPAQIPELVDEMLNSPSDPSDPRSPTTLQVFQAKYGRMPTDKEIRDSLEYKAELHATELMSRLKPKAPVATSQVTPSTPPATEASPSLSNQHAASVSTGSTRNKSREEIKRELKARLEAETATRE